MDANMGSLMRFLREDKEYKKTPLENIGVTDSESFGVEDYEKADLEKVKSQTLKNVDFAVRKVKDSEVEPPVPTKKASTKESKGGQLFLCTECARTFRSSTSKCPTCRQVKTCESLCEVNNNLSDKIAFYNDAFYVDTINYDMDAPVYNARPGAEIVFTHQGKKYRGEVSDIPSPRDQDALQIIKVVELPSAPDEEEIPDEDTPDIPDEELKDIESADEGKVPSKDDDQSKMIKKLTENEEGWNQERTETKILNPIGKALGDLNLGYYYSESRTGKNGSILYTFTSLSGAPEIVMIVRYGNRTEEFSAEEAGEGEPGRD